MNNNNDFDSLFHKNLLRRLIQNQARLWTTPPANKASEESRIARLVSVADRTMHFAKVLRESLDIDDSSTDNEPSIKMFLAEKEAKSKKQKKHGAKKDSSKNKKPTIPASDEENKAKQTVREQLLDFARNNPFPVGSRIDSALDVLQDKKKTSVQVSNLDRSSLSPTINKRRSSTNDGSVLLPVNSLKKNIDLLRLATKASGDDQDNSNNIRVLHLCGTCEMEEEDGKSKGSNKKHNAEEQEDGDKKKKNKSASSASSATPSLLPVQGARLQLQYANATFLVGGRHPEKEEATNYHVVGEDVNGTLSLFCA